MKDVEFAVPGEHFAAWGMVQNFRERCEMWIHSLLAGGRGFEEARAEYEGLCAEYKVLNKELQKLQTLANPKPLREQSPAERLLEQDKRLVYMLIFGISGCYISQIINFYQRMLVKGGVD